MSCPDPLRIPYGEDMPEGYDKSLARPLTKACSRPAARDAGTPHGPLPPLHRTGDARVTAHYRAAMLSTVMNKAIAAVGAALVPEADELPPGLLRVGRHDPALAGRDLLVRVEGEGRVDAVRADRTPLVARLQRLAGVLDQRQAVPVADGPQLVELVRRLLRLGPHPQGLGPGPGHLLVGVRAQLVGDRKEPRCLSLRMVVEQDLSHGGGVYSASPSSRGCSSPHAGLPGGLDALEAELEQQDPEVTC